MLTEAETQATEQETVTKPEFNEVQQARIAEIIKETQGRAAREVRAERDALAAKAAALEAELQSTREKTTSNKKKEEVSDYEAELKEMHRVKAINDAEVERLRRVTLDKDKEIAVAKNEAKNVLKRVAMQDAAGKVQFFDPAAIIKISADDVVFDENAGKFVVKSEDGSTRLNNRYEPMTLEEYFKEYAAKNPYTVRGDVRQGTGQTANSSRFDVTGDGKLELKQIFGKESSSKLANDLAMRDPALYKSMKKAAQTAGIIT